MFRYLAQRYHPDNQETSDRLRFDVIMEAHDTLRDPAKRTQYDIQYKNHLGLRSKLAEEAGDSKGIDRDIEIQNKLLAFLYVKRRQNIRDPGINDFELERLTGVPVEHLEFHLWYLKEKGWVRRTENGTLAITIEGVDHANSGRDRKTATNLLTDHSRAR